MKIDNKVAYRATALLASGLSLIGAVLAAFGLFQAALLFLGIALASLPVLGHLRMREQLSAVRRMPQASGSTFDGQPVLDQLSSMERKLGILAEEQSSIQNKATEDVSQEIHDAVNQLRRESRLARIAAAQITGKL